MCRFDVKPISSKSTLALMVSFVFPVILSNVSIRFLHMFFSKCASHQEYVLALEKTNTACPTNQPFGSSIVRIPASFSYLEVEEALLV
jgi:hypothetical protein